MTCPGCARENRAGARFCSSCGTSLAPRCPGCGAPASPDARFCDACGAALAGAPAEKAIARKVVTVVFADLIGSMALHERRDAESARRVTDRYHRAMTAAVEVHGGRVVQLLGDGVLAAFGVPRVAEDDAIRAVRAAVGMQRAFRELAREQGAAMEGIGLRVAVNTGEIVVSDDETAVIGDASNVAARLQHEARDGEVIVGEATQRLVGDLVTLEPLGSFALRGREGAVAAHRVVSLERPARAQALAFVGRDEELRRLLAVYDAACSAPGARLAVLLGSPGLGKSRLLGELARRAGERASVLEARCDQARGATFAPLAEALRAFLRLEEGADREKLGAAIDSLVPGSDAERARITAGITALLSGAPSPPEETFFVVRRFLAALAAVRPVVFAIDDLHWAEPLLLDLVEHLVQWSAGVPLTIVAAARPELREARSSLVTPGPLVAEVVTLTGLEAGSAMRLAANVIGASELPAALAGRVLATSEGNPLFVAELVRMLVQDGTLRREGDRWVTTVELASLEMPPTIQVLLAARIERLRAEERALLERAAVIGRHFSRAALAHLLGRDAVELDARLEALRRSELIEPDSAWFLGEPGLRFHHVLIRDAAYRRLLRETRAELHERFADWVAARAGASLEHDETLGWHLEQAHENLRELGPLDARGRSLGERAARHLGAAGQRALARDDVSLAAGLLGRALGCLEQGHASRADLALDWCEALLSAGDVATGQRAIAELGRLAGDSERLRAWHTCFRGQLAALTDPQALRATAGEVSAAAEALAGLGDAAGEAKAHSVHATTLQRLGEIGACETALDRALSAARRARDRRRANAASAGGPQAALWGPTPVTRASGRCLDVVRVLRITERAPAVEAVALRCQALLEELRGRSDAARRMIASSRQLVEELGIAQQTLEADVYAGHIELLEGEAAAAERYLRGAYDGLRERGLGIDAARAGALLGRALLAQDRSAEAESLSHESEALAGDDLKAAMGWRGVRAEALARRGEHASAIELALAAVEIAAGTDDLLDHADARMSLAVALRGAGRDGEAAAEERRALELWEQKGATLLVERARRGAGGVAAVSRPEPPRPARRRVSENWATAHRKQLDAAMAGRNVAALPTFVTEDFEAEHRPTGRVWGRDEFVARFAEIALGAEALSFVHQPLATLGDELGLFRLDWSAAAFIEGGVATGAVETQRFILVEAEPDLRASRIESFAEDHLAEAISRLYERYVEHLPEGPERERAAAIARSVAARRLSIDDDSVVSAVAPDVVYVDHRRLGLGPMAGVDAYMRQRRAWAEIATDIVIRDRDVLALRPDALLTHRTHSGTDRVGGGAYERDLLTLWTYGADGRVARCEFFDVDREADAFARFEEATAERPTAVRRRVRPNAATQNVARTDAAVAARDEAALLRLLGDEVELTDHVSGTVWDRAGVLASFRNLLRATDAAHRDEPLATLGDSLGLFRRIASATSARSGTFDVGAYEIEVLSLIEVDARGRVRRGEQFAADHLSHALARLYERYAELLPEGAERVRAAAVARSMSVVGEPERWLFAPDVAAIDHRTVGFGSVRGGDEVMRAGRAMAALSDEYTWRADDVVAARPDSFLLRLTNSGTERSGGGSWERQLLVLCLFGDDGRLTRLEEFEAEDAARALARFDDLTVPPPPAVHRRVRPNAATANAARSFAAIGARDLDALAALFSESFESVPHWTGSTYGRDAMLAGIRKELASSPYFVRRDELLATLGDSLALFRISLTAPGAASRHFDVGDVEREQISLFEVDAEGLRRRTEGFAPDRLGDAIVRLYERYGELLPEAVERERAASVARSVATLQGPHVERLAPVLSEDAEFVDRRTIGLPSAQGAEEIRQHIASLVEAAPDSTNHIDDVFAVRPDALLARVSNTGTDGVTGGAFERTLLRLVTFGSDGRVKRLEQFDVERVAEALARFEELAAERPPAVRRRVRANAATEHAARAQAAHAARDFDAVAALFHDSAEAVHHPTGATYGRDAIVDGLRRGFASSPDFVRRDELLATLGESLALVQREQISLFEVDAQGLRRRTEIFAPDRLSEAVARLYERHAELLPEGAGRERALKTARSVAAVLGPYDVDAYATGLAATVEYLDHRTTGFGSLVGVPAVRRWFQSLLDNAEDVANRFEDVLELRSDSILLHWTNLGTARDGGGAYERRFLWLGLFGPDGLVSRVELFEDGRDVEALARFEELTAEPPKSRFENAATRSIARTQAAHRAYDRERVAAELAPDFHYTDRRTKLLLELDRAAYLDFIDPILELRATGSGHVHEVLRTRGNRLALTRNQFEGGDGDWGAVEMESLVVVELNEYGARSANVRFDPDDLDAAYAELDARYAAGEGRECAHALERQRAWMDAFERRDFEALAAHYPVQGVVYDHRKLGFGVLSVANYVDLLRPLVELAPDVQLRVDHWEGSARGSLMVGVMTGTRDGGEFELPRIVVREFGRSGELVRIDHYDHDQLDAAKARFEELRPDPLRIPENAATRATDRQRVPVAQRDWDALRALVSRDFAFEDRNRRVLLSGDAELYIRNLEFVRSWSSRRVTQEVLAIAGDRLALARIGFSGDVEGSAFEGEFLRLTEVDAEGLLRAVIHFSPEDRRAAFGELFERWFEREGARYLPRAVLDTFLALNDRDFSRVRDTLPADFFLHDHLRTGLGRLEGMDAYLALAAATADLSRGTTLEPMYLVALDRHGALAMMRSRGILAASGGEWESTYLMLLHVEGERVVGSELFEAEDVERAKARFEELRRS